MGDQPNIDMCTAPALANLPDWMHTLLDDHENEIEQVNGHYTYLKENSRKMIFKMVSKMSLVNRHGIGGISCKLVEHFISVNHHSHGILASQDCPTWSQEMRTQFVFIAFTAIILTAKVRNRCLPKSILEYKIMFSINQNARELMNMEIGIMKAVGYKIPLWSTIDIAQALAMKLEISLPQPFTINIIAEVADYSLNELMTALINAKQNPTGGRPKLATLHLAAASVAAYLQMYIPATNVVPQISKLVRAPDAYIELLVNRLIDSITTTNILRGNNNRRMDLNRRL